MQAKIHNKLKRVRGRPKTSNLSARELARNRKRRQRAKLTKNSFSKIEVFVPNDLKREIAKLGEEKSLSEIGLDAFRLWLKNKSEQ